MMHCAFIANVSSQIKVLNVDEFHVLVRGAAHGADLLLH